MLSEDGADPYVYKGTSILKNLRNITDHEILEKAERRFTENRVFEGLPEGKFDLKHFCALHKHMFQDLYAWAGELRTIRISKGTSMFCYPENIKKFLEQIFAQLKNENFLAGLQPAAFANRLAYFHGELNAAHPFREGNGRTLNMFCILLVDAAGHDLQFDRADPATFLKASIEAFEGRPAPLASLFMDMLS